MIDSDPYINDPRFILYAAIAAAVVIVLFAMWFRL